MAPKMSALWIWNSHWLLVLSPINRSTLTTTAKPRSDAGLAHTHLPMRIFCTSLLSLLSLLLAAQSGTLAGVVTATDEPAGLIGATVQTAAYGVVTDIDGGYSLPLPPGKYTVTVSFVGYAPTERQVTVRAGQTTAFSPVLAPAAHLLQTATVTTSKHEKPLGEVTVSLEVIRPDLIENTNQTNLEGVLEKVPGVSIVGGQANIRGGSGFSYGAGSRVLLLVDDIPILQADAGFPNWDDVPIENIAQVEVIKGAASALYGSAAMNGIINVRTAYAKDRPETAISAFGTAYGAPAEARWHWWDALPEGERHPRAFGGSVVHRRKLGKLDLVAGSYYLNRNSYNRGFYTHYGRFNLNTRYRITDRLSVGLNSNINKGESSSFFYWAGLDSLYEGNTASINENTRLRYHLDPFVTYFDQRNNRHKLLGRFYAVDVGSTGNQDNRSNSFYGEYQYQRDLAEDFVLTGGVVLSGTSIEAELYGDTLFTSQNVAGYLQLDKTFFDRLNVSGGFRYEYNRQRSPEIFAGDTIPDGLVAEGRPVFRLGANYQVADFTFLRASYGQGYRYPTVAERFIRTNAGSLNILPNPSLRSETGWSGELGLKQGFQLGGFNGYVDLAAFWSEYQNMIEFNLFFDPATFVLGFKARNVGATLIRGGEISVGGQGKLFGLPTTLLAGYTYLDPQFREFDLAGRDIAVNNLDTAPPGQFNGWSSTSDQNILKYRFRHTVKFDVQSRMGPVSVGVGINHNSFMENIDRPFLAVIPQLGEFREGIGAGGSTIINPRVAYHFSEQTKLSLLVNNATNAVYALRPGLLEAPRNYTLRADHTF